MAAHMLCYLQDMNGPGGPLLAVPGSHLSAMGDKPVGAEKEAVIQVDAKAGDVVFFTVICYIRELPIGRKRLGVI